MFKREPEDNWNARNYLPQPDLKANNYTGYSNPSIISQHQLERKASVNKVIGNYNGNPDMYTQNQSRILPSPQREQLYNPNPYENQRFRGPSTVDDTMDLENNGNLEGISMKHDNLVQTILKEEEDLIIMHRKHIDEIVEFIKEVENF